MKIYEACTKTHAKGTTHWHPLRFREPETDIDDLANKMYVAAVQPDTLWWDDLPPEMQDGWRRAARAALKPWEIR